MNRTNPQSVKQNRRDKQMRREAERLREQQRQRRKTGLIVGTIVLVVAIMGVFIWRGMASGVSTTNTASTPDTTATNSQSSATTPYAPLNGITCDTQEQLAYHVHAHLSMYIDGKPVAVPQTIGIASDNSCIYWLHTHDTSGIIHIESPTQKKYTLGDFTQLWGKRFSNLQYEPKLDQATGWKAYVDGKPYSGDFHNIELQSHTLVTLAYNSPDVKPDTTYAWQGL
ncbi:hypothetical protein KDA_43350 [Dictyobacter alpinus]|uniref:Uncharacterized protein n=1 Tax=Dictyobacter alpinus TaxID=2014873 RepID=A0A402BBP5_9CHLR|nr:hypothetical protein [Dictyobacter alpinus]GCE28851.1 hypothetical protein KDA_43350 [Dictyobacter alpinus]